MYKVFNNSASNYLHERFQMRDANLDNTTSNLRSVARKNYLLPPARCKIFKGIFSYSGVVVWNSRLVNVKNALSLDKFVALNGSNDKFYVYLCACICTLHVCQC